jgi:CheY-like chemotaxis protein
MTDRARRAARALLDSNRAQTEFLANMSHEIRTPLNGVVAVADALAMTRLDPRQEELVEIIRTSGATLERLLSDVLDLARIETGAVTIEAEPFHLAEAVRAAVALHRPRAGEKGLELAVAIPPAAEDFVLGDAVRLKQILTNLLSNAVKFTAAGHVRLSLEAGEGAWRFTVEDTGVGFDPGLKERLFNRFQQADGSVTRQFGGTGLGLAICRQLAGLMGGAIEADSRPGAGARFTLALPLPAAEAPAPPVAPASSAEPAARPLRVLLADDHPVNRRVVEVLLEAAGAALVSTENGREAVEAYGSAPFDVVLMDMQMPVMDGLSATTRIRELERRLSRPAAYVVMLTANALREHQEASLAAGADAHLAKPIEAARLYAVLAEGAERTGRRDAA